MSERVRAEEIAFYYPQNRHGLDPVSLSLQAGEGVYISGVSGAGKSTLARCLTGLIPHLYRGELHGQAWANGLPTHSTPLWEISEQVGLVFQNPAYQMLAPAVDEEIIFGLENLGLERSVTQARMQQVLQQFNLTQFIERQPQTLSGGEQQKLALAAILARRPPVLVLDEPLSMLDTTAALEFVDFLAQQLQEGTTLVICEHRFAYLEHIPQLKPLQINSLHRPNNADPQNAAPVIRHAYPQHSHTFNLHAKKISIKLGGNPVVRDVSINLPGGQMVALVGRNGAGKTTLLRAIAGMQKHEGQINITPANDSNQSANFGMVFQNPDLQLFNASVRDEILYKLPQHDPVLYEWLLDALGLRHYENTPPLLLSEGEKRRVALATALIRKPQHGILLDEPSLGQDPAHKTMLANLLHAVSRAGYLVLYSTHDLELAAQAERLVLMAQGRLVADGPTDEVFNDSNAWNAIELQRPNWMRLPCFN